MCCRVCIFVIQCLLTINHTNLLGKYVYLIFIGESEASKYCSFKNVNFYMHHLERKHFGDSVLRNI